MIRRKEMIGNSRIGLFFGELGGCRVDVVKIAKKFYICKGLRGFFYSSRRIAISWLSVPSQHRTYGFCPEGLVFYIEDTQ